MHVNAIKLINICGAFNNHNYKVYSGSAKIAPTGLFVLGIHATQLLDVRILNCRPYTTYFVTTDIVLVYRIKAIIHLTLEAHVLGTLILMTDYAVYLIKI